MEFMSRIRQNRLSVTSRGTRCQFGIGIALVSIIPILAFWCLKTRGVWENGSTLDASNFMILLLIAALGITGYTLLRTYPANITKLRNYLEHLTHGKLPEKVCLVGRESDIATIEKCMNLLVDELKAKVEKVKHEKDRLQQELFHAQKTESLGIMAMGIAHSFNNFLSAILGNIDVVINCLPPGSPVKENAEQVRSTALCASELINQLLSFSAKGSFAVKNLDVSALIKDMINLLKDSISMDFSIEYQLADNLPTVRGDPEAIRRVVMNLVMNASEAMVDKSGTITVSTGVAECDRANLVEAYIGESLPEGQYVYIEVSDTGCGMTPEIQTKIFDPFFSTKIHGYGMGLSVVFGIIYAHRGAIKMQSESGKGSTFQILLPCDQA